MSEFKLSGETTKSTGNTKTFNYVKPQAIRRTTKGY